MSPYFFYFSTKEKKLWEVIIEIAKAIRCLKNNFFSIIGNGFGLLSGLFFIFVFVLRHHMKLHVLNESTHKKSLVKVLFHTIVCLFLLSSNVYVDNTFISHVKYFLTIFYIWIFLPKYYINQNPSLKLYVNYYHYQPAPILPWQLPNNFDPDSVQLNIVKIAGTPEQAKLARTQSGLDFLNP